MGPLQSFQLPLQGSARNNSSEADTRLKNDNKRQEPYDHCCILDFATMRVLACRDEPFDSLEELTGISIQKKDFLSWICLVDDLETEQMDCVS